ADDEHLPTRTDRVDDAGARRDRGPEDHGPFASEEVGDGARRDLEREVPGHEPCVQRQHLGEREAAPFGEERREHGRHEMHPEKRAEELELPDVAAHGGRPIAARTAAKAGVRMPCASRTTSGGRTSVGPVPRRMTWTANRAAFPSRGTTGVERTTWRPASRAAACTRSSCD